MGDAPVPDEARRERWLAIVVTAILAGAVACANTRQESASPVADATPRPLEDEAAVDAADGGADASVSLTGETDASSVAGRDARASADARSPARAVKAAPQPTPLQIQQLAAEAALHSLCGAPSVQSALGSGDVPVDLSAIAAARGDAGAAAGRRGRR